MAGKGWLIWQFCINGTWKDGVITDWRASNSSGQVGILVASLGWVSYDVPRRRVAAGKQVY